MKEIKDLLCEHNFFNGMTADQLELLAGCGRNVHFKAGAHIIKEGDEADYFYVIRKGKISLDIHGSQRGIIQIQTIEEGEILGWSWLIPPHIWSFSARVVEEASAVALDGACLRKKCEEDHELGYQLLTRFATVLAKRLEWTRIQLLDVYHAH